MTAAGYTFPAGSAQHTSEKKLFVAFAYLRQSFIQAIRLPVEVPVRSASV